MKENKEIVIINTGGTFSKEYNKVKGELEVKCDKIYPFLKEKLILSPSVKTEYKKMICKDSLFITCKERMLLAKEIVKIHKEKDINRFVIIHGTDTMHKTARFLEKFLLTLSAKEKKDYNKKLTITFTGAMVPLSINQTEASANFACALVNSQNAPGGIYIAMNGICSHYLNISKDYKNGVFILKKFSKKDIERIDSEMDIDKLLFEEI